MMCPECGNDKTYVISTVTDISVERFRKCPSCGYSFLTKETVKVDPALIEYEEIQLNADRKVSR